MAVHIRNTKTSAIARLFETVLFVPTLAICLLACGFGVNRFYARQANLQNPPSDNKGSGPSLKETLDWISQKITIGPFNPGYYRNGDHLAVSLRPIDFTGCVVSWEETFRHWHDDARITELNSAESHTVRLPLYEDFMTPVVQHDAYTWQIVQNNVNVWAVTFSLKDKDARKIRVESHYTSGPVKKNVERLNTYYLLFSVPDEDNKELATRVAKAFTHAIQLCQSQKPQKNNEPF